MTVRISDDVVYRTLDREAVILNLATGTYFGLNEVGTRMWQLMAEHGSPTKIVEAFLAEYDAGEQQVRIDLDHLIRQLVDKGLVKPDAEETPPSA